MRDIFWILVILLLLGWGVGFFAFGQVVGELIHILLVVALIMLVIRLVQGTKRNV
ncbi:lmo0937 family membrane protein [Myroides sp. DF42-4-2]|uniref:lmo0937 family membrane protein n=1 Tax=unclassified Myroides TaxID=2642485 RepID=UPI00257657C8|nr:lmo0937 family membrane protein [Myroides sp. DF42-4-2]MDM1408825.1 lmo0937 family membrane protein [Myroides sp. DF42-4-2]